MNKLPISVVIITLNEEANIARCIESVSFAAEVIVVDSGSQDKTLEIAKKYGAKTFYEPWQGFGPQKNHAVTLTSNDWILSLDADEVLSHAAAQEIMAVFQSEKINVTDAFIMPRKNWYCGRWMRFSSMYPDYQARFFHKERASWTDSLVHEKIQAKRTAKLNKPILHWSFRDISHQIDTINRYSSLRAREFLKQNKKSNPSKMFFKTLSKFLEIYFIKRGFLDGAQGLMVSITGAFATYLRWAKLYELQRGDNKSSSDFSN